MPRDFDKPPEPKYAIFVIPKPQLYSLLNLPNIQDPGVFADRGIHFTLNARCSSNTHPLRLPTRTLPKPLLPDIRQPTHIDQAPYPTNRPTTPASSAPPKPHALTPRNQTHKADILPIPAFPYPTLYPSPPPFRLPQTLPKSSRQNQ